MGAGGFAIVFLALFLASDSPDIDAGFTACKATPSKTCLTDWGVEKALAQDSLPPYLRAVDQLARMGRIEDARALEFLVQKGVGETLDVAGARADRRVASHRLAAALRSGTPLADSIRDIPEMDAGVLWIAALDLLDRNPYGAARHPDTQPANWVLTTVSNMAHEIQVIAASGSERRKRSHFTYAAELFAAVGDRQAALDALLQIPDAEDTYLHMSPDLIKAIGVDKARDLNSRAGKRMPLALLSLATAEDNDERAADLFVAAFDAFASRTPSPDFSFMFRTVRKAVDQGHADLSLRLAKQMAQLADKTPSSLPVFGHIDAARALSVAGAPESDIRESIDKALALFPENPSKIVGVGLVSGPIIWGASGLDASARIELSNLFARIGDLESAERLMDGLERPVGWWSSVLSPEIPVEHLAPLLLVASKTLNDSEMAYLRASLAADDVANHSTAEHRAWALSTVKNLLEGEALTGQIAVETYLFALRVATESGAADLNDLALERLARAAVNSGRYADLIRAGFEWHRADHG
ncbi:hypothetical protein [Shimia biformata]|uniref:hypothetical protein n=1 Tax=Shimia biformata TaxID=1294299 RepID=UPI00194F894C|nr:hypothetical protein [Shimia biformata]